MNPQARGNGNGITSAKTPGKRFAIIPRAVVLHRMETADCLDSRLFWAIILWSWCGVEVSADGSVVLKDEEGWIRKDAKGNPLFAKQDDLRELLGLAAGMKGHVSRAIARLAEVGSIRFGNTIPGGHGAKVMYPVQEPPLQSSRSELPVQATLVWHIGTRVVSTDNFKHLDKLACAELKTELDDASTQWLSDLKAARTKADRLVVQALSRRGILIEKSLNSRKEKAAAAAVPEVQVLASPKPPSDQQQQSESPIPIPTGETTQVQEVLLTYGPCDLDSARRLIQRCRDKVPDATTDEIAQKIFECARNIDRGTRKPVGLLLDIVPKSFENYKRQPPETGREIESKIAAWKKAVDEDWETDEGKAAAREHLQQHGISYP